MPSGVGLHVAIYDDGGIFKHWGLFIDGPSDDEKVVLNIMGSSTRYRFEMQKPNDHTSATLLERIYLCHVDASKMSSMKNAAENAVIHNEYPGYNCQDYVLELLDDLEEKNIIDGGNADYRKNKDVVKGKQEGLD